MVFAGQSCYRPRRTGERKKKSVRGCIVDSTLSVISLVLMKKDEQVCAGRPSGAAGALSRVGLAHTCDFQDCD